MKKMIRLALSLVLCALTFVGCTKDEDAKFDKCIIGKWQLVHCWRLDAFSGQYYDYMIEDGGDGMDYEEEWTRYIFKDNGIGIYSWWDIDKEKAIELNLQYVIVNNGIRLRYEKTSWGYDEDSWDWDDEFYTIESISSKKMMWVDEDKMEYEKIK
ncbi:hypothetical protein HDR68_03465 [bacterium]|nr:hypothetical protein [bacterium]